MLLDRLIKRFLQENQRLNWSLMFLRVAKRSTPMYPVVAPSKKPVPLPLMTQTWLTQEAADRLRAELTQLEGPGRKEVTAKIEAARAEGDLKENGGYHAARDEQGKMEARIRQLKQMLDNAHIGTPPASADGKVGAGMVVTAIIAGDEMKFLIGSREISSGDLDVYSEKSPLGAAVLGQEIGAKVSYTAPNGREISVEIVAAEFYS
jgi:transcription elongation factor GreA